MLNGLQVAIVAADRVERVELKHPRQALEDADAITVFVSIRSAGGSTLRPRWAARERFAG